MAPNLALSLLTLGIAPGAHNPARGLLIEASRYIPAGAHDFHVKQSASGTALLITSSETTSKVQKTSWALTVSLEMGGFLVGASGSLHITKSPKPPDREFAIAVKALEKDQHLSFPCRIIWHRDVQGTFVALDPWPPVPDHIFCVQVSRKTGKATIVQGI